MARQNIDEEWKTDPRRRALAKLLGNERLADGMRVEINWLILDHKGKPIPLKKFKFVEDYSHWIECGLAEIKGDMVVIAGADRYAKFFDKQSENGSKGGRPKEPEPPIPSEPKITQNNPSQTETNPNKPSSSFSLSSSFSSSISSSEELRPPEASGSSKKLRLEIWGRYSNAYFLRYGTEPVRNATVNSKIKSLAERLGDEAKDVVEFYVSHNKAFYVSSLHPIGLCLQDCEGLRTQWATGRMVSQKEAQQADSSTALASQLKKIREGSL